jgi:hypothetical protein
MYVIKHFIFIHANKSKISNWLKIGNKTIDKLFDFGILLVLSTI